jgi:hypothetical protein
LSSTICHAACRGCQDSTKQADDRAHVQMLVEKPSHANRRLVPCTTIMSKAGEQPHGRLYECMCATAYACPCMCRHKHRGIHLVSLYVKIHYVSHSGLVAICLALCAIKIKHPVSFKLYSQGILRALQKSESQKLSVPVEVLEVTSQIRWQLIGSVSCTGVFVMQPLTDEQYETLDEKMGRPICFICLSRCSDIDDEPLAIKSRHCNWNCIRCNPCCLCPNCQVTVRGNPVCMQCMTKDDYEILTDLSATFWKRVALLSPLEESFGAQE